jgi:hypothetical protein
MLLEIIMAIAGSIFLGLGSFFLLLSAGILL